MLEFLSGCGLDSEVLLERPREIQHAIINGSTCPSEELPASLAIIVEADIEVKNRGKMRIAYVGCGGTLIAPDVVLTAAHCVTPIEFQNSGAVSNIRFYVSAQQDLTYLSGKSSPGLPKDAVFVKAFQINDFYSTNTFYGSGLNNHFDVGILFLSKPLNLPWAHPIRPEEGASVIPGLQTTIVGWGRQRDPHPHRPTYGVSGVKMCAKTTVNEVGAAEIQVGSTMESPRKCYGDSGSASYAQIWTKQGLKIRLIGITSHSYQGPTCAQGGVDMRVDVFYHSIDRAMQDACQAGIRVWCDVPGVIPDQENAESASWVNGVLSTFFVR